MLDFYFAINFTDDRYEEYVYVTAPTAMLAWECLDKILKVLEWSNINYGKTRLIPIRNYQNSKGEFFENFSNTY